MYEHELVLSFKVRSDDPDGEDLTLPQVRKAVARRMSSLNGSVDWKDAVLPPICTCAVWPGGGKIVEIRGTSCDSNGECK